MSTILPAGAARRPAALCVALCLATIPGHAREAYQGIEEITVTGTKQGLSVQDTVASVSVYNSERMEREVVFELDDIFLRTANVSSPGYTGGIAIRGVARNGVGFAGAGNTSNIYINGAPLSDLGAGGIESLWDVEQVEILRGPQSTVQGRNSLAGAIVVKTRRPSFEQEASARIRAAELGTRQYSIAAGSALVGDSLAGRLALDRQEYDGDVRYATQDDLAHEQRGDTWRLSLLLEPESAEDFRFELIGERVETFNRDTITVSAPTAVGTPEQLAHNPFGAIGHQIPQFFDRTTDRYIGELNWGFTDSFSVVTLVTYEDSSYIRQFGDPMDLTRYPDASNARFDAVSETFSAEVRLEYASEKLTGRVGAYLFDEESLNVVTGFVQLSVFVPVEPPDSIASIVANFETVSENMAWFGELRYEPNERWALEFGLRYDEEENLNPGILGTAEVDPPDCMIAAFVPRLGGQPCLALLPQDPPARTAATFDAWLPRGAFTWRFDELRSLSFSVQRGYRAGGSYLFLDPAQPAGTPPRLEDFDPEFIINYELSLRSLWFGESLLLNANLYVADWTDQQVTLLGRTGINDNRTVNVGESRLQGLEVETQWFVNDNLELFATLGYSKTRFIDFPYAVNSNGDPVDVNNPVWADLSGNEFQNSPNLTGSVGAYYRNDEGWFVDTTLSYTDGGYSDVFNLEVDAFDSQTIANVRTGYDSERYRVFFYVNNLFNNRAVTEANFRNINADSSVETFPGPTYVGVNRPRVVGLQAELKL